MYCILNDMMLYCDKFFEDMLFTVVIISDEAPARERLVHGILLKGVLARGKLTDQCPDTNKLPAVSTRVLD